MTTFYELIFGDYWDIGDWIYMENKMIKNLQPLVIPAEAGIQVFMVPCFRRDGVWIPAFAGMTLLFSSFVGDKFVL
jgi:hypothetical protein